MLYLGTVVISFAINTVVVLKIKKDIDNKGYKLKDNEKNVFDTFLTAFRYFLISMIPVGNVLLSSFLIISADKLSKSFIRNAVREGELVKKQESQIIEVTERKNDEGVKINIYKIENNQKKEMTREEKLDFLREEYRRLTREDAFETEKEKQHVIDKRR